jgi:hypothetical protein
VGLIRQNLNASVRLAAGAALVVASGLATGCMSSPTYGTDKTASEQLATDLSNIVSFSPKQREPIDYTPRPELVKPAKAAAKAGAESADAVPAPQQQATLPPPQESVASAGNPNWPESPEQRLARVRAEATEHENDPGYTSPVVPDVSMASTRVTPLGNSRAEASGIKNASVASAENEEFKRRLKEIQQGDAANRKYLSEPPLEYRDAYASAPQGEVGEDESKKERRLKREARKKAGRGLSWDDVNPF